MDPKDFKKVRDEWETPPDLYRTLNREFKFTLDPASTPENVLVGKAPKDGLAMSWAGERVYCNPPYSNWRPWVEKAKHEALNHTCKVAVLLLPVDTSTKAFHQYIWADHGPRVGVEVRFLKSRLKYYYKGKPGPHPARFASMVVVFGYV